MTLVGSSTSVEDLVPGDPAAVDMLADGISTRGRLLAESAVAVGRVSTGGWEGRASLEAETRVAEVGALLGEGGEVFAAVVGILDEWGTALRRARRIASKAVETHRQGERLTRKWQNDAPFGEVRFPDSPGDPGSAHRSHAEHLAVEARDVADEAAGRCADRLYAAADAGYRHASGWHWIGHHALEVAGGIGDGVAALLAVPPALFEAGAWLLDTTPSNVGERVDAAGEFLDELTADSIGTAKHLADWDTLIENPDRWFGQAVPDVLAGIATKRVADATGISDALATVVDEFHANEMGAVSLGVRKMRLERVIADFENQYFRVGDTAFILNKNRIRHILARHHPKYWNGTVAVNQTFFASTTTADDIVGIVREVLNQNWQGIAGSSMTVRIAEGQVDGQLFRVGWKASGSIGQVYPIGAR